MGRTARNLENVVNVVPQWPKKCTQHWPCALCLWCSTWAGLPILGSRALAPLRKFDSPAPRHLDPKYNSRFCALSSVPRPPGPRSLEQHANTHPQASSRAHRSTAHCPNPAVSRTRPRAADLEGLSLQKLYTALPYTPKARWLPLTHAHLNSRQEISVGLPCWSQPNRRK